jgi:hypothetical protein
MVLVPGASFFHRGDHEPLDTSRYVPFAQPGHTVA